MIRALGLAIAVVLGAALVGVATLPTGAARADAVAPSGTRVAGRDRVGDAQVLLVSDGGRLQVVVAYRDDKGWFGVPVTPPPRDAAVAWTATKGSGRIPALSSVYGRVDGVTVEVRWRDGRVDRTETATDGTFVIARPGRARSATVLVRAANGDVAERVEGP
jgi:hypothetical protein